MSVSWTTPVPNSGPSPETEPSAIESPQIESSEIESSESWDEAPCGLLRIDRRGLVLAANARLLAKLRYPRAEVVGQLHWNDLLMPASRVFFETQLAPIVELDGTVDEVMLDLRAADGLRVPALVNAVRVCDATGASAGARIAILSVPDRQAYENELRAAREQAETARAADRQARLRLELLARANAALASSVEVGVSLGGLARVLVAELADWCVVYAADPEQPRGAPSWSAAHTDPGRQPALEQLARLLPRHILPQSQIGRALAGAEPVLVTRVSEERQRNSTDSHEVRELYRSLGLGSVVVVPSTARGDRVATMILGRGPARPAFTQDDLADLTDLAARAGIVIDNLRRHAREHSNSIALQKALLTSPPETPRLQIVARYLPATAGNEVGGDWYDAFCQPDGAPVLAIGDVVGHDIRAAAAMGQLRGVIRTLAYTEGSTPADILTRADTTAHGLGVAVLASALVARVDEPPAPTTADPTTADPTTADPGVTAGRELTVASEVATLRWSNAGHPPPLLVTHGGTVRVLDDPPDPMLGIFPGRRRHEHAVGFASGDTLLLYTDGLVEDGDHDIDLGIARLADRLIDAHRRPLDQLCDLVLAEHEHSRRDDIAVLAVRRE